MKLIQQFTQFLKGLLIITGCSQLLLYRRLNSESIMRYEIDLNRKPLMNFDEDIRSEGDEPHQNLVDDDAVDADREISPTPVYIDSNSRPREQLVKNSSGKEPEDEIGDAGRGDDYLDGGKTEKGIGENSGVVVKKRKGKKGGKKTRVKKSGEGSMRNQEEDDAELNRQGKPALTKLKKLYLLTDVVLKKPLQPEFLDHGVLSVLKAWIEPLPDGSFPNINVREAVFQTLIDLPIDVSQDERTVQLKKSCIDKAVMYFSENDEYKPTRKLAKELVKKWRLPILSTKTRFKDMEPVHDRRMLSKPPAKRGAKSGESSSRQHASRPEAVTMVRPQSQVDPEAVRLRAAQAQNQRQTKLAKRLQKLRASRRKNLQAMKPSADGRGMV